LSVIVDITLKVIDAATVQASWTGGVGLFSTIFVDGQPSSGPVVIPGTAKLATVNVETGRPFTLHVIEQVAATLPQTAIPPPNLRPTITWSKVPGTTADYFFLEYMQAESGTWIEFAVVSADENEKYFSTPFPFNLEELDGSWWLFRVTAFDDESGASVIAEEKARFVFDYGKKASTFTVVDNAPNLFDISAIA